MLADVSSPTAPAYAGQIVPMQSGGVYMETYNTMIFVGDGAYGLYIVDIADPVHPQPIARLSDK
jgi:hypothetical protein